METYILCGTLKFFQEIFFLKSFFGKFKWSDKKTKSSTKRKPNTVITRWYSFQKSPSVPASQVCGAMSPSQGMDQGMVGFVAFAELLAMVTQFGLIYIAT